MSFYTKRGFEKSVEEFAIEDDTKVVLQETFNTELVGWLNPSYRFPRDKAFREHMIQIHAPLLN